VKVLVVEQPKVGYPSMVDLLGQLGYTAVIAADGNAALQLLQHPDAPRIAIVDWLLPDLGGPEFCRRLRAVSDARYTYCLVRANTAPLPPGLPLEAGADDLLPLSTDLHTLDSYLRSAQRIVELQEQLIAAREALRFETTHDGATGVLNRAGLLQHLRREYERSARFGSGLGIILVDLDYFRIINESFGYHAGDLVLREVATRISSTLRAYDIFGRYGADEFLIIAPEIAPNALNIIAERVLGIISGVPVSFDGQQILVTAALGTASVEERTQPELVLAAEAAVKQAKQRGRNCIEAARGPVETTFDLAPNRPYLIH
jgi:two-component system, cell cycle response regulator